MWPALLRGVNQGDDDEDQRILGGQGGGEDDGRQIEVDEQQVMEDFRTLNWSRLVSVS